MKSTLLLWIGFVLSLAIYFFTILFDLDLFERVIGFLESVEAYEFDEVIIPLIIFGVFSIVHLNRLRKKAFIDEEKSKIYLAMLSSSFHILRNLLNQIQFFKREAEETPGFSQETITDLDKASKDALDLLENLSHLEKVDEQSIKHSVGTKT